MYVCDFKKIVKFTKSKCHENFAGKNVKAAQRLMMPSKFFRQIIYMFKSDSA